MSLNSEIDISEVNQNALVVKNDSILYLSCPQCPLPAKFNIETNKNKIIIITSCQERHNVKMELREYLDNQHNKSLICNQCSENLSSNQLKMFYCFNCKQYFCYSCKSIHKEYSKNHIIANLLKLGTKCISDNKECIGYCDSCNRSFCNFCKLKHINHFICDSSNLIFSYNNLNKLQKNIKDAQVHIEKIKQITNKMIQILEKKIEEIRINSEKYIKMNELELEFSKEILTSYTSKQNNKSCIFEVIDNALNFLNFNIKNPIKTDLSDNFNIENESKNHNQKLFDSITNYIDFLKNKENYILKTISKNHKNFSFQLFNNNTNNDNTINNNTKNSITKNNIVKKQSVTQNTKNNTLEEKLIFTSKEIEKINDIYEKLNEIKKNQREKIVHYTKKTLSNGIYIGDWNTQTDSQHGRGILREYNGNIYQGYFSNGKKNGFGIIFYFNNISIFRGKFENDNLKFGTLSFPNGKFYRGNFVDNKYNGYGMLYGGNYIYEGQFKNGKKFGYGVYKTKDGIYEGEFQEDTYYGFGKWSWNNGDSYFGFWQNGVPFGFGNLSMSNGKVYSGDFYPNKENPMYCSVGGKKGKEFSYMKIEE